MRHFVQNRGLSKLPWESKAIYSAYLVFSIAAYVVIGVLVSQRTGTTPADYADHYLGNEASANIDFDDLKYAKSVAELLETTHFHLFSYPLFILVQGHLFIMTAWPARLKVSLVLACFAGAFGYLLSPWLVHWFGGAWAWVSVPSRIALGVPLVLFVVVPLWEMWRPQVPTSRDSGQSPGEQ